MKEDLWGEGPKVVYCWRLFMKMIRNTQEFWVNPPVGWLKCYTVDDFEQKMLFLPGKLG